MSCSTLECSSRTGTLRLPDGSAQLLKVRSMVGLLPLCAVSVFEGGELRKSRPELEKRLNSFFAARPELIATIHDPTKVGHGDRRLGSILSETRLRRVLARMLDSNEFLSDYGLRSLSRYHADHPFVFHVGGQEFRVPYTPGESDSGMFGGNSNWRGPICTPVNALIIRALLQYYAFRGTSSRWSAPAAAGTRWLCTRWPKSSRVDSPAFSPRMRMGAGP